MIRKTLISAFLLIIASPCYTQYLENIKINRVGNDSIEIVIETSHLGRISIDTITQQKKTDTLVISIHSTQYCPHIDSEFLSKDTFKIKENDYLFLNLFLYDRFYSLEDTLKPEWYEEGCPDSLLTDYFIKEEHFFEIPSETNSSSLIKRDFNHFNIYPNPATTKVFIDLTAYPPVKYNINIYSANGQKVKMLSEVNNIVKIDVSELPDGLYFIVAAHENEIHGTSKFLKKIP